MKNFSILLAICILLFSCETESLVVKNTHHDNLTSNTELTAKLRRVSQYPTTLDNIADGTSCFSLHLPVTVVANGQTVVVNTENDYQQVRNILASDDSDVDTVALQFPVNVTYTDYSETAFQNQSQFDAASANCTASAELSCIVPEYPIGINTYNTQSQLSDTFDIGNKLSLYQFLGVLGLYDVVSLIYPLQLNTPGGTLTIENNDELEAAIDDFTDECLAALNPDPDPINTDLVFAEVIVAGVWHVSYLYDDGDLTANYAGYHFTFNTGGTAMATTGMTNINGTWESFMDSGELTVNFDFGSNELEAMQEDWAIIQFTETQVTMKHESGGGGGTRYLTLVKD